MLRIVTFYIKIPKLYPFISFIKPTIMAKILNISQNSDQELLKKIKEYSDNLGYVYKNCKSNSIRFMKKMTSKMNEYELEDVFQDAILVLYEKITKDPCFSHSFISFSILSALLLSLSL